MGVCSKLIYIQRNNRCEWSIMKNGFTLIELLVVIAILALLLAVLLPSLSKAKKIAKVTAVNSELRQIGISLEMYMQENNGKHPPTRKDCSSGWADHQLPPELVAGGYLPPPASDSGMSAGIEDRFNPGQTYKYWAVGELYQNGRFMPWKKASLYIPEGFPDRHGTPETSPVTWIIYSQGPEFDEWKILKELNGPVPKRTWYNPKERKGIITRVRLKGILHDHIGTFK
mgnify:CR=1 FL=1